jgi:hypothetical protein
MSALQTRVCRLLSIPRELRDEIYFYYFLENEGYHHQPERNTLRCSNGTAINLALMYTCKQVVHEVKGLPLNVNTVTFRMYLPPLPEPNNDDPCLHWSRAGRFDFLPGRLHYLKEEAFAVAASKVWMSSPTRIALLSLLPHAHC